MQYVDASKPKYAICYLATEYARCVAKAAIVCQLRVLEPLDLNLGSQPQTERRLRHSK